MTDTVVNCRIHSTMLGPEDHGMMSSSILLEGDGWTQSFGGYALDNWNEWIKRRVGVAFGIQHIMDILSTLGVERWEKLPGTAVRAKYDKPYGKIIAIGHYMKDQWYDIAAAAKRDYTVPQ